MSGISRRGLWAGALAASGLAAPGRAAIPRVAAPPLKPLARVIVDNDFGGDPDGLLALAYQLAAPTTKTVLVTTSALDANLARMAGTVPVGAAAAEGAALARELVGLARLDAPPSIVAGSETFGVGEAQITAAAQAIVAEARRASALPLFVTCGGPLTNVAAALRLDPSIARRMTLVWIGGRSASDGGEEYNLSTDIAAARQVIEESAAPLWQVPLEAYQMLRMSQAQMLADLRPISPLTAWLHQKLTDLPSFVPPTGVKGLGDVALAALTAISPEAGRYEEAPARRIGADSRLGEVAPGRTIRLYRDVDNAFAVADMLATLRLNASRGQRNALAGAGLSR